MKSPAPTRSTQESATVDTTRPVCRRCLRRPGVEREGASESASAGRPPPSIVSSGMSANRTAVATAMTASERQHPEVDRDPARRRQGFGDGRRHRSDDEARRHEAHQAARRGQDRRLHEQELRQASAARAERRAHGDLARPRRGPAEDQRRDVGARHQQHEADGREQQQERPLHPPGDLLSQRRGGESDREARVLQLGGIRGVDPSCQDVELRPCFAYRHALLEPADHAVVELAAASLTLPVAERHRYPDAGRLVVPLGAAAGELEARRHDADHRVRPAVERDRLADDRGVASVARLPEAEAQQGDVHAGPVLVGGEVAAHAAAARRAAG